MLRGFARFLRAAVRRLVSAGWARHDALTLPVGEVQEELEEVAHQEYDSALLHLQITETAVSRAIAAAFGSTTPSPIKTWEQIQEERREAEENGEDEWEDPLWWQHRNLLVNDKEKESDVSTESPPQTEEGLMDAGMSAPSR